MTHHPGNPGPRDHLYPVRDKLLQKETRIAARAEEMLVHWSSNAALRKADPVDIELLFDDLFELSERFESYAEKRRKAIPSIEQLEATEKKSKR